MVDRARTGVRVLVVGGQYDVMQALALLRARGAHESELRAFVTDRRELPVFCGHCQSVTRAVVEPGGEADCRGCGRVLEVHEHAAATLGAFLASDARAGAS
nr:dimethylamine monooxygenase subunit DmmA family protein [Nocardioides flavescens]